MIIASRDSPYTTYHVPFFSYRLSGAQCLHYVGLALPSQLTLLLDYLLVKLKTNRGHPLGLVGYSHALAALLATAKHNELGVPLKKAEELFEFGKELVSVPNDRGNLSVASTQSGWAIIGAFLTLGEREYVSERKWNIFNSFLIKEKQKTI